MIGRRERRALPARGDIGGAHIVDDGMPVSRASSGPSPSCTVSRSLRPVQNRLAVKADDVDAARRDAVVGRGSLSRPRRAARSAAARHRRARPAASSRSARRDCVGKAGARAAPGRRPIGIGRPKRLRFRRASPSVSITATSMPSSEVPLISPSARNPPLLAHAPSSCMFPAQHRLPSSAQVAAQQGHDAAQ